MSRWADLGSALAPNYRVTSAFSANKPDRLSPTIMRLVHFREKTLFCTGHFVIASCVFIHIPGGCFIFNISRGQRPVSDLE